MTEKLFEAIEAVADFRERFDVENYILLRSTCSKFNQFSFDSPPDIFVTKTKYQVSHNILQDVFSVKSLGFVEGSWNGFLPERNMITEELVREKLETVKWVK